MPDDDRLLDKLPDELARRLSRELDRDERLIWVGQPLPDLYARSSIFTSIFGIFFTGFALLWMVVPVGMGLCVAGAGAGGDDPAAGVCGLPFLCFALFGLPFLLVGGMLITSPIWQRKLARRTCYALTDGRGIALQANLFGGLTIQKYGPRALEDSTLEENADGSGNLIFRETLVSTGRGFRRRRYGFIAVEDVARVDDLIRRHVLRRD